MAVLVHVLLIALSSVSVSARVNAPAQSQLPLIARTGQAYSWSLRPDTFVPPPSSAVVAKNLPSWLTFDASTLTFSGSVPSDVPEGKLAPIRLTAGDDEDKLALYVSSLAAPTVAKPLAGQLRPHAPPLASVFLLHPGSALGAHENGLRVPPGWSFSVGWDGDTFVFEDGTDVAYAARLANGDELPPWMTYDPDTMTFAGVAPNIPKPTTFGIVLYGGDEKGYQAVQETFTLTVAAHELSLDPTMLVPLNVSSDSASALGDAVLVPALLLDGEPVSSEQQAQISVSTAPSSSDGSGALAVTATLGDQTIHANVPLRTVPSLFRNSSLPALVVAPGGRVSFDISPFFVDSNAQLSALAVSGSNVAWLSGDASARRLVGTAPAQEGEVQVTVEATAADTRATSKVTLPVTISGSMKPTPQTFPPNSSPDDSSSTTDGAHQDKNKTGGGVKINKSILAAILGALIGFILLCTFAACFRKMCAPEDDVRAADSPRRNAFFALPAQRYHNSQDDLEKGYVDANSSLESKLRRAFSNDTVNVAVTSPKAGKVLGLGVGVVTPEAQKGGGGGDENRGEPVPVPVKVGMGVFASGSSEGSGSEGSLDALSEASYDYTTDTSSTISEPLEADNETPRRRPDFGPSSVPQELGVGASPRTRARRQQAEIVTAARVGSTTPRRIATDSVEFMTSILTPVLPDAALLRDPTGPSRTPEIVQGVRLVSRAAVVESSSEFSGASTPRLAPVQPALMAGRGVGPASVVRPVDPRTRAFGQMRLVEPSQSVQRESTLSYLSSSSAGEDADEEEDQAIVDARRALGMGRGVFQFFVTSDHDCLMTLFVAGFLLVMTPVLHVSNHILRPILRITHHTSRIIPSIRLCIAIYRACLSVSPHFSLSHPVNNTALSLYH
ncbi:hypothetical protein EXIGLDRAFT_780349 [Exidia glandulosa HHB12029]|uniref:Dystroglycan-type cadherin-like domain-containing protein n=1 Tax=Exidia glandulosa HHB12029 TaxID=1314781 RepID=A0A165BN01_EXIGL|nr:hypothetical protein EXIGLDRAFT_780349 [Exidia glandulosa HHB12029]